MAYAIFHFNFLENWQHVLHRTFHRSQSHMKYGFTVNQTYICVCVCETKVEVDSAMDLDGERK